MVKLKGGRHTQAKKAFRQSEKRRKRNLRNKKTVRAELKLLENLIQEKKKTEAMDQYKKVEKLLDKIAGKNIIHKNTAARKKSRLFDRISRKGE